jgi:hypothetical protein
MKTHQLQKHADALHKSCNNYDMKINIKKTEVMEIGRSNKQIHLKIENEGIQQTKKF